MDLKEQYERFPYPPIFRFALPSSQAGQNLTYEYGQRLGADPVKTHDGIRILVAGSGTFEALLVAQQHPRAQEVVAVDLSSKSISILNQRLLMARLVGRRLAPVRTKIADLRTFESEPFDYILASNLLHHCAEPGQLLRKLATLLKPDGYMRVVTYPRASRIFMRETGKWLRANGIHSNSPRLKYNTHRVIGELPEDHPIRVCFSSHPESHHRTGIVDSFLNALENPLSPEAWEFEVKNAGLTLFAEDQIDTSKSDFLLELDPKTAGLSRWQRLQILDDLLEICANPILWFKKTETPFASKPMGSRLSAVSSISEAKPLKSQATLLTPAFHPEIFATQIEASLLSRQKTTLAILPSQVRYEMGQGIRRADSILRSVDSNVYFIYQKLKTSVGSRRNLDGKVLPGLSLCDFGLSEILAALEPWEAAQWLRLQQLVPRELILTTPQEWIPGQNLAEQSEWLQARYGVKSGFIGPITIEPKKY